MYEFRPYTERIARMMTWSATLNNYTEHEYPRLFPFPNLSISTIGCMESGKDVSEGGAKYNSYGGTATGLATTADSLTAIKYMIFDKKSWTKKRIWTRSWPTGKVMKTCSSRSSTRCRITAMQNDIISRAEHGL